MSDTITDEEFARLRARLEAKQEEFLFALRALSGNPESGKPGSVGDQIFRLLGIVTFWLSLEKPSRARYEQVLEALRMFRVVKVPS